MHKKLWEKPFLAQNLPKTSHCYPKIIYHYFLPILLCKHIHSNDTHNSHVLNHDYSLVETHNTQQFPTKSRGNMVA